MQPIVGKLISSIKHRWDAGDLSDQLNYQYSPLMLFIVALILMGKQYCGKPIQCWVPAQFTPHWEKYAETHCFIQNTYYLPLTHHIPQDFRQRDNLQIGYYQWVPLMLVMQGIMFCVPLMMWRFFNWQSEKTMDAAIGTLLELIKYRYENGHDLVDRISYEYTPLMLLVCASGLMGNLFFGNPIQCWFPAQFTGDWESYAHDYCYIKNTYYLPLKHHIPQNFQERDNLEISYYQWVPFVLVFQAIMFIMPCILWRFFSWQSVVMKLLKHSYDSGDMVDRLNYEYTPLMLFVCCLTLVTQLYIGEPIQCWVPPQFTRFWEKYTETYCFIKTTYFLPLTAFFPNFHIRDTVEQISYYQWVPVALLAQAILFILPRWLWRAFNLQSGVSVKDVLNAAAKVRKNFDQKCREGQCTTAAVHIQEALDMQFELKPAGRFCGWLFYGSHYGNYVTGVYLFIKFLYILNVIGQFFILNSFLGPKYSLWGFEILRDLANGREWEESTHFPRVTMCDFQVRVLGNLHRWTVQCVLMINMFNEKIYIFFWWWFLLLAILSILSFFYWALTSIIPSQRRAFVAKYLRVYRLIQPYPGPKEERLLTRFLSNNLRSDGVLLIRMIQGNGGELLTGDLIQALWLTFKERVEGTSNNVAAETGFVETPADTAS